MDCLLANLPSEQKIKQSSRKVTLVVEFPSLCTEFVFVENLLLLLLSVNCRIGWLVGFKFEVWLFVLNLKSNNIM